ncbi:hypothetical protein ES705_39906 [subsurface metagenome]
MGNWTHQVDSPADGEGQLLCVLKYPLRYKMNDVLKALDRNEKVTVLYHGNPDIMFQILYDDN